MNLEQIELLENTELLSLYSLMVRVNHYDPFDTPAKITELYEANISEDMLLDLILKHIK